MTIINDNTTRYGKFILKKYLIISLKKLLNSKPLNHASCLIVLFFFFSFKSLAASPATIILDGSPDILISGNGRIAVLEDAASSLNMQDILQPSLQEKFKVIHQKHFHNNDPNTVYWVKFKLKDVEDNGPWLLEILDLHLNEVSLYDNHGNLVSQKTGYNLPFSTREYHHKNFVYQLKLSQGKVKTYYLRLSSKSSFSVLFKIRTHKFFTYYALNEYLLLGLFYGIIVIMGLYNLFIYLSLKDKTHLFYVFYVLSVGTRSLLEDGLGFKYLWPNWPELNEVLTLLNPLLLLLFFLLYSHTFLETRKNVPVWHRWTIIAFLLYLIFFIVNILIGPFNWHFLIHVIPFVTIYMAAFTAWRKGYRPARYYILGYSFIIFSLFIFFLRITGIIPGGNILTVYAFNIGFVFEIVTLSYALGDKIKIIKQEKEIAQQKQIALQAEKIELGQKVNKELEQKVQERTTEIAEKNELLNEANTKLQQQAEEINKMNLLLDKDNRKLEKNILELTEKRVTLKKVNIEEFMERYPDEQSCYKYLAKLKWETSDDYLCKKCGNTKYFHGTGPFARKCTKCGYNESVTLHTLFENTRFPINKGFYILFLTLSTNLKISSHELSRQLDLRQKTCWNFQKKVINSWNIKSKKGKIPIDWEDLILK